MLVLRSSTIGALFECPQKYHLNYELGVEPAQENPILTFGTAFHAACEERGKALMGLGAEIPRLAFLKAAANLPDKDKVIGECLVLLYQTRYRDERLTYEAVEKTLEVPLPGEAGILRLKLDGLVRDHEGKLWIMEHKTTRQGIGDGEWYWENKVFNLQIELYLWAAEQLGLNVEGVIYDVVRVPKLRVLGATPKDKQMFYKKDCAGGKKDDPRPGTRLRPESMDEFKCRVQQYILANTDTLTKRVWLHKAERPAGRTEAIIEMAIQLANGAKACNPASCFKFMGRPCEYLPICLGETSSRNRELYKINPNPLDY